MQLLFILFYEFNLLSSIVKLLALILYVFDSAFSVDIFNFLSNIKMTEKGERKIYNISANNFTIEESN